MNGHRRSLYFVAPRRVEVRQEPLPTPGRGEVLVEMVRSAISPGTEMLVYRGQVPRDMPLDASISALTSTADFPLKYGYSAVGRVVGLGADAGSEWLGKLVMSLHPHESHFVAVPSELRPVPPGVSAEEATLLPTVETAVTFLMDGRPIIGEQVAVFGQGVVGLLTTALLARLPLAGLVAVDRHSLRREWSLALGAHRAIDPSVPQELRRLHSFFDLAYELSGSPAALDEAISATGFCGRVVIGSWYGDRRADLHLGGAFHRSRIQLVASQVSTIAPRWEGRWNLARRLEVAWRMLEELRPARLITHRFPFSRAGDAYHLIDRYPEQAVQVILEYGS
jgi:2-desacetyl-2-hydroxyethyl bacteriochlorophyllide A dehydrogenase